MKSLESVMEDADALSLDDRWVLVEHLLATAGPTPLPPAFNDPAFVAEIRRRAASHSPRLSLEEVLKRTKAQ